MPAEPEVILPGGPHALGDSIAIRGDRPSRFVGQELISTYEDTPYGRITYDSPGYAYHLTKYSRRRRSTRAVHDAIWGTS
jgi:hypothetical protein